MDIALDGSSAGRVAIVTGGSRGVGRATIGRLAASGYAVVVNYLHDQGAAESTVETILAGNGEAVAVRADVADELDVERLFAETIAAFGGIDVVVHAVGCRVAATPLAEADLGEFDALVRISTRATFIVNREAARRLRNGGAIVNLSSSAEGPPRPAHGLDAAIKAATDVLTRALALELRERASPSTRCRSRSTDRAHLTGWQMSSRTCSASVATISPARCLGSAISNCGCRFPRGPADRCEQAGRSVRTDRESPSTARY
jgi:NADP-dependent 3-hydroxy acid dehydrogenase YdfG